MKKEKTKKEFNEEIRHLQKRLAKLVTSARQNKQAKKDLGLTKTKLKLALLSSKMGVWEFNVTTNKCIFDNQVCLLLGIDPARHGGSIEEFFAVVHPDDRENIKAALKKTIEQAILYEPEFRALWPDGSIHYISARGTLSSNKKNNPQIINGIIWDITKPKIMEENLKNKTSILQNVISGTNAGTWEWNVQTGKTSYNERWAEIVGYTLKEFEPTSIKTWEKLIHPDDFVTSKELLQKHFQGLLEYYHLEYRMKHKDGSWVWVADSGKLVEWDKDGNPLKMFGTHIDITKRKKTEEELKNTQEHLFQASKMAALGQLSAGAAHEINNPLTGIIGFTEATLLDLKNQKIDPDKIEHNLNIVLKNAERCRVIISNLLNFAMAKALQWQESDINNLLDDTLMLVEYNTITQNIQIVKRYEKNLPKVNIDRDQITQVFINVISNAQKAMPDGGELLIKTWSENNFVLIECKDTGVGIEKENLLRVFEPFFTTSEPGLGVGLGLSLSYTIMMNHEGSIEAKSEGKNKGASFIITFPVKRK